MSDSWRCDKHGRDMALDSDCPECGREERERQPFIDAAAIEVLPAALDRVNIEGAPQFAYELAESLWAERERRSKGERATSLPATIDDVTNWLVRRPITELAVAYRRIAEEIEARKVIRGSSRDEGDE